MIERDFFCPKMRGILQSTPLKSINVTNLPRIITQVAKEPERFPQELVETKNRALKRVNIGLVVRNVTLNVWSCKSCPVLSFGPTLWLLLTCLFSLGVWRCLSIFFAFPIQQSRVPSFQSRITLQLLWLICHVTLHRTVINKQYRCVVAVLFWSSIRMHVCLFDVRRRLYQHIFSGGCCSRLCLAGFLLTLAFRKWFQPRGLRLTLPSSPLSFTFIAARQLGFDCVLGPGVRMVSTFCSTDEV